jgi:hypothetical protein
MRNPSHKYVRVPRTYDQCPRNAYPYPRSTYLYRLTQPAAALVRTSSEALQQRLLLTSEAAGVRAGTVGYLCMLVRACMCRACWCAL